MPRYSVILPAAGSSRRFAGKKIETHLKKPFVNLKHQAVWLYSAQKFLDRKDVGQLIVVVAPEDEEFFRMKFDANRAVMGFEIVLGGAERIDSVRNALKQVCDESDYVAIHDAARPCLRDEWIDRVFAKATENGAAILATPIVGTVKKIDEQNAKIEQTISRRGLWQAQTPQVFEKSLIRRAYDTYQGAATDDAQVVEALGIAVDVVECPATNLKITTREDLKLAEGILRATTAKNILNEFAAGEPREPKSLDDLFG